MQTVTGRLGHATVAQGSKGERPSLVLETTDGQVLLVRRRTAPTFGPDDDAAGAELSSLAAGAGTPVEATGTVVGGTLLADTWRVLDPGSPAGDGPGAG